MIHKCKTCKTERKGTGNIIFIVNELMIYETYCLDCARKFFKDKKFADTGFMNISDIKACAEVYSLNLQNEVLQNPEKLKAAMQSQPVKKVMEELLGKEEATKMIDKRIQELSKNG